MFDKKIKPELPVTISFGGKSVTVYDDYHYQDMNILADHFYQCLGYKSQPQFDYYLSNHPMESNCFMMALTAKWFSDEIGQL